MLYHYRQFGHKIIKTDCSYICTKGVINFCTHLTIVYQVYSWYHGTGSICLFNNLNAQLNPICHLLALFGAHHILHVSRIRVN